MAKDKSTTSTTPRHAASQPTVPTHRLLRGYAFDPSLATSLETALVGEVTYKVPWEPLRPGPRGEYVEVVDYDPPSGCFYAPVDLDHPYVLAQQGLAPSEGNPQFHQQMAYVVAMTTIDRFERALGRRAVWAERDDEEARRNPSADRFVQRLRIYPHALRAANAYYSRDKGSLLLGYFPATEDRASGQFPGGMVFTCLSHDVIAHETAHALLDGFHPYFMEATSRDVLAFHEAFADIVALFQHFTFPEVLAHQIAKARGDLTSETMLGQLATQVGHARGMHGALRDAIGKYDDKKGKWIRQKPDPNELDRTSSVHARGAILVAAVFDAFLSIYLGRTRDLLRLATGGTGVLPQGDLHPDLVGRLAAEASKSAGHVLNMCIRALDYCPPVDLTFGEYLRALITADMDLMAEDQHGYRIAFIEAFRRRGIYPRDGDVRTLSEDSLRWAKPEECLAAPTQIEGLLKDFVVASDLRTHVDAIRHVTDRRGIWEQERDYRRKLHGIIGGYCADRDLFQRLTGLAFDEQGVPDDFRVKTRHGAPVFSVQAVRESRRSKEDGRVLNQVFMTILQKAFVQGTEGEDVPVRCGSTLVFDLDTMQVTHVIGKGLRDPARLKRIVRYYEERPDGAPLAATYFAPGNEPFAALHHSGA